jgi:hypothetical protein
MLGTLIAAIFSGEAAGLVGRARRAAIVYVAAVLCVLIGIGFLIGALYIWLSEKYGSLETAIGFGAVFILVAGVVLAINAFMARAARKAAAKRRRSELATIAATAAVSVLPGLLRGKVTPLSIVVAPLMAFLAYSWLQRPAERDDSDEDEPS